jgi:hypothetical protein
VFKKVWLHLRVKNKYLYWINYIYFPFMNDNCVIVDVSMHCKNLSFLEFFVTPNHIEVLFYMKKIVNWMKLIRMLKAIFFKNRKNKFLFNNKPRHYTKCFSIGSCKTQPLCRSNNFYFKNKNKNWLVGYSNKLIPSGSLKLGNF